MSDATSDAMSEVMTRQTSAQATRGAALLSRVVLPLAVAGAALSVVLVVLMASSWRVSSASALNSLNALNAPSAGDGLNDPSSAGDSNTANNALGAASRASDQAMSGGNAREVGRALDELLKHSLTQEAVTVQLPTLAVPLPAPRPAPVSAELNAMTLSVIVASGARRNAIIDGRLVHEGDTLEAGAVVTSIKKSEVQINQNGMVRVLTLRASNAQAVTDSQGTSK